MQISRIVQNVSFFLLPTWRQTVVVLSTLQGSCKCHKWLAKPQSHKVWNICKVCACNLFFWYIQVQTMVINKNCTKNDPKKSIFKTSSLIYTSFCFVLPCKLCMAGSSGFQDLFGIKKKTWLLSISPELWFLSLSEKTWYLWFHIVSYRFSD